MERFKDEMAHKEYDRIILDKFSNSLKQKGRICDAGCGPSGHIGKYLGLQRLTIASLKCEYMLYTFIPSVLQN